MLFDAHNHLQDPALRPHLGAIIADLEALPIGGAVVNGTHEDDWADVSALAGRHAWIIPSYGLHPWHVGNSGPDWFARLREHIRANPGAAVGEIGIDRWMLQARPDDHRLAGLRRASLDEQAEAFRRQLVLARDEERAATIHCIRAWDELVALLEHTPLPGRGFLIHAYAGPVPLISRFAKLGAYFSFSPNFLPAQMDGIRTPDARLAAFLQVPEDRLLIETDAPAMSPPPVWQTHALPDATLHHPGNLLAAARGLAHLLDCAEADLIARTSENARRLFAR